MQFHRVSPAKTFKIFGHRVQICMISLPRKILKFSSSLNGKQIVLLQKLQNTLPRLSLSYVITIISYSYTTT